MRGFCVKCGVVVETGGADCPRCGFTTLVGLTDSLGRVRLDQADSWFSSLREGNDPYAEDRCCVCHRMVQPGATRIMLTRTDDGEWWVVSPDAPVRSDEHQLGDPHFSLSIGSECLRDAPWYGVGLLDPAATREEAKPSRFLAREVRPAHVARVAGCYVVTGICFGDMPAFAPSRSMRIRRSQEGRSARGFVLEIADAMFSRHDTLRDARIAASLVESHSMPCLEGEPCLS